MHDRLTIRDAAPEDVAVVAEIYNASAPEGDPVLGEAPKREADVRRLIDGLGEREALVLLEHDDDVLGWGLVKRYSDRPGYRFCGEILVFVRPDQRRRGYGSRIKQALVERSKAFRYHHLLGRVWGSNAAGLAFHEAFGYEVVGIQRDIGYLDGRWEDVVVLQKVLESVIPANSKS